MVEPYGDPGVGSNAGGFPEASTRCVTRPSTNGAPCLLEAFRRRHTRALFREDGTIVFDAENALHFRTLGTGHLAPSPNPGFHQGTVTWELDGGSGRFAGASGRITSNFTVTDEGDVADDHLGVIFLTQKGAVE
jgi:hypothetical protein